MVTNRASAADRPSRRALANPFAPVGQQAAKAAEVSSEDY